MGDTMTRSSFWLMMAATLLLLIGAGTLIAFRNSEDHALFNSFNDKLKSDLTKSNKKVCEAAETNDVKAALFKRWPNTAEGFIKDDTLTRESSASFAHLQDQVLIDGIKGGVS